MGFKVRTKLLMKPCPFCNGEASLRDDQGLNYVVCEVCEAQGPKACDADGNQQKTRAVAMWNLRRYNGMGMDTTDQDGPELVKLRPNCYVDMTEQQKYVIDRELGLLDWKP